MTSSGTNSLVAATAAVLISLVFVRAAWHKLRDVDSFAALMADYGLLPSWALGGVARGIIAAEVAAALTLLMPGIEPVGASLAAAMLLIYTAAMAANILRGRRHLECGCGGSPQGLGWPLVARNLALTGIAALALRPSALSVGDWALGAASGLTLWVGFLLMEQLLANASRMSWAIGEKVS